MAATLHSSIADLTNAQIQLALGQVRPAGYVAVLLENELADRYDEFLDDGSDAYVRHLELRGYDDARAQEAYEAAMGIPA